MGIANGTYSVDALPDFYKGKTAIASASSKQVEAILDMHFEKYNDLFIRLTDS